MAKRSNFWDRFLIVSGLRFISGCSISLLLGVLVMFLIFAIFSLMGKGLSPIDTDYILKKVFSVFLTFGLLALFYRISYVYFFLGYRFKKLSTKHLYYSISILLMLIGFISFISGNTGFAKEFFNSHSKEHENERIIITFIVLIVPAILGVWISYKKLKNDQGKEG